MYCCQMHFQFMYASVVHLLDASSTSLRLRVAEGLHKF